MVLDKDLQSIQEVRDLMKNAKTAQKELSKYSQAQIDELVEKVCQACVENAEKLAKMAAEETGFGIWQDKVVKNLLGSRIVTDYMRNMKTVGIIKEDRENGLMEVAVPVGVVAALIPSTNPTSTTMFKGLISIKSGNSIVISPHPNAKKCILETVAVMREAADKAGAPKNLIQCIETTTIQATNELMKHPDTGVILATGGEAMVKAAYSSGNPAIGVGPGNGPAFIERSADIPMAIKHILDSKTFDNGTICASEQSIVTEKCIQDQVLKELQRQGGYLMDEQQSKKVEKMIMRANNTMNPAIVGKSVQVIADMAGIQVPKEARVLVSMQTEVGKKYPYSREKLCPILAFFVEDNWESACEKCIAILENEGAGHTMTIHSQDEAVIREFALKKPISRLLVNTPGALGGVGATTKLAPALTLGCGAVGGSATSDNVGPMNLINIRRVAWGVRELEQLRPQKAAAGVSSPAAGPVQSEGITQADIERIAREVLQNILKQR
ncbi:acetaldehyde dehydrogenase (acetylating) [Youxingia wuxianensis]|uniref:Acetaldehyde dehydrogenase (Acetylating) n=1 Tax=Youxingia wuxianensis TaxID=2763678 RepID=A0A926EPX1_9FIRM|nr:acetaldehyde dehydrogenase (acetylating) [Youxingia wuxianensis]MBC8585242.1 acetaldehyde dehydrogenase (acetylating) [Youxingia wuxianensis]